MADVIKKKFAKNEVNKIIEYMTGLHPDRVNPELYKYLNKKEGVLSFFSVWKALQNVLHCCIAGPMQFNC